MIVKIVKIFLALSLVLWAVWDHFQGGSLCLTSSVCWFFRLTSSVVLWGGGMLQTNSTVMCTQCLSPTGPVPVAVRKLLQLYVALPGTV